ncbi:MAG: rhodanese-like domain-containing protein [Pirellulales bacterium]
MQIFKLSLCAMLLSMFTIVSTALAVEENTKDSLETVKKNVGEKKAVLVDVREKKEWDEGHIDGSVFLPLSELKKGVKNEELAKRIPKDRILYTFCVVGKRAITGGTILEKYGYEVRALKPGYKEIIKAGFKKAEDKKKS